MQSGTAPRSVKPVFTNGELTDLVVHLKGKETAMLGPAGLARELSFLPSPFIGNSTSAFTPDMLPVLLGSGLGYALEVVVKHLESALGPDYRLAVVDKEVDLLLLSKLKDKYGSNPKILWVSAHDAKTALSELTRWQNTNGGAALFGMTNPFYLRLDRQYYGSIRSGLETSAKVDFWNTASYPKFKSAPRVLLLTSSYFLMGDVAAAAKRMGLDYRLLQIPEGELAAASFVEQLLEAVVRFKPDFALTINHLGVDREGILQDLLVRLKLPLASWFVDNPHLILYKYRNVISPWTTVFTWDTDNIASLRAMGFEHVEYLPLATDHLRFAPMNAETRTKYSGLNWQSRVSFVGNSMLYKVEGRLKAANPPESLKNHYQAIAAAFAESDERSVYFFMEKYYPELLSDFIAMGSVERQLNYETLITWEATLRYRLECVKATLPFNPLIVGDDGWLRLLPKEGNSWRRHKELGYYAELPYFYPFSELNFNCTSKQMKGAVNQRVFDVPATGSFVITDWRDQLENLFEPGKEVICYHTPEEATGLIARYLDKPAERAAVTALARKRILAEHLYEHRLEAIIRIMCKTYA